ncbi:type II toxin-antitoxin system Phd/YefM family antitoxin [Candidatus Microgenomates bacterium]|nr:type II toxin-antitoxin system Phd/YefM family antitoxin [Candidatus Microgenomates bacterium]
MNISSDYQTLTASQARANLYNLIKSASTGLKAYEITLQGANPVILVNKAELEAWQETLDILSNKGEIASIRKARKQKKAIPHQKMLKAVGLSG